MKQSNSTNYQWIFLLFLIQSCSLLSKTNSNKSVHKNILENKQVMIKSEASLQSSTLNSFDKKLLVNGTIEPSRAIELKMDRGGLLQEFKLVDGRTVAQGQLIAQLGYHCLNNHKKANRITINRYVRIKLLFIH